MLSRKVSRRELLLTFGVLGGGLLLPSSVLRAQTPAGDLEPTVASVPFNAFQPSHEATITASGAQTFQTTVMEAPKLFTDMLFRWRKLDNAEPQLEVRVSSDGSEWSTWGAVAAEDLVHPDQDPEIVWSYPLYAGQSRFYQVRVTLPPGVANAAAVLDTLQVHLVDAHEDAPAQLEASSSELIDTLDVQLVDAHEDASAQLEASSSKVSANSVAGPPPYYISRTRWGNPHGESAPKARPDYQRATHLVVHHTADPNFLRRGEPNWAARVRAIWSFHTHSLGWGDIGYNWLIDPNGVIYAGRAGSTDYGRDAVGFHDASNYGSMGVAVLGTYTSVAPPRAAQDSLVRLLSWKARQRGIDAIGRSKYAGCARSKYCAPYNRGAVLPNITGHRPVVGGRTACPGDKFLEILPIIRQRVAQTTAAFVATTVAAVNMRSGPGTNHRVQDVVPAGALAAIRSGLHNGAWYEVAYRSMRGFIHSSYLRRYSATTISTVNLRGGPGFDRAVWRVVPGGAQVSVYDGPYNGVWYEVIYSDTRGYIHGDYLRF